MAVKTQGLLANKQTIRTLEGGATVAHHPFKVYITGQGSSGDTAKIKVSQYSRVFNTLGLGKDNMVPLVGIDLELEAGYGAYIFLETYYDANLEPIISFVRSSTGAWSAEEDGLYPSELQFVTSARLQEMESAFDAAVLRVADYQERAVTELDFKRNTGQIDAPQYTSMLAAINSGYEAVTALLNTAKSNLNQFFAGAPNASWKKLFRTFTLIAYSTKNLSPQLGGTIIEFHKPAAASSSTPIANTDSKYQLVQCLNTDLYLAEICYQNRYPARLPMPYHRGVPPYYIGSAIEDEELNS